MRVGKRKGQAGGEMYAAEAEYITSNVSLDKLAKKYGYSRQAMCDASAEGKWVAKRAAYRKQVRDGAVELSARRDTKDLQIAVSNSVKLLQMIQGVIDDPEGMRRYIAVEGDGAGGSQQVERTFQRVDALYLKQIVDSQKTIVDGLYKLFGLPTQAEAHAQKIADERLKIEKAKQEAEEQANSGGAEIVVDQTGYAE